MVRQPRGRRKVRPIGAEQIPDVPVTHQVDDGGPPKHWQVHLVPCASGYSWWVWREGQNVASGLAGRLEDCMTAATKSIAYLSREDDGR